MPAGCRICSRARQSRANRQSAPPRQSRRLGEACQLGEARRVAEAPPCQACRAGAGRLESFRVETGRTNMRSLEIPDRRRCRTYRRIGRRDQRPQRRRVRLQSAAGAADRGETEGRRLCRDQAAGDRGQGQARAWSGASPRPTICTLISSCRSTMIPCPTNSSRTGNSRARRAISATASAAIPSSSPADNPDFKTSLVVRRTDRQGNEGPGPALCRAIYASPSWAGTGTRC